MNLSCVTYRPASFAGHVTVPPSKSVAHRAILCAALAGGDSILSPIAPSEDMTATIGAVRALGARTEYDAGSRTLRVQGITSPASAAAVDCIESGSTLRFLIPVAAALGVSAAFTGRGRLPQRPIGCYTDCLPQHGVACRTEGGLPLGISGRLTPGEFAIPGNISSQFITGLLFALPLLPEESRITLTTPLESAGYVDITIAVLKDFGVTVLPDEKGWVVPGGQRFMPRNYTVEGDWSQAAFFLSMGALSANTEGIFLHGLRNDSAQGDRAVVSVFRRFGAQICETEDGVWVRPAPDGILHGITADVSTIPDLVPAMAACGALCEGTTVLENAARLRLKESDRLAAMEQGLQALGAKVCSTADTLTVIGQSLLSGGTAQGCNDHRIVMALSACAARCTGEITVTDAHSIRKSYPDFFEDYNRLGGDAHVFDLG